MTTPLLQGRRVTVMGLGRFGGGLGAARFLAGRGAIVTITDRKPEHDFADAIAELRPLINAGHVRLSLGGSLLEKLPLPTNHVVVLELSSAMLYWLDRLLTWSPTIAVCTNLSPNHADWHGNLDHYAQSKQRILRHQRPTDAVVLGPTLAEWAKLTPAHAQHVREPLNATLAIPGTHNRLNAAVALNAVALAARAAGKPLPDAHILAALQTFPG
ncbi:MAG: Mur ligase family protein, partial [bacterium]